MGNHDSQGVTGTQIWPHLWTRDGFLGTNSVVLRPSYLPRYQPGSGPHGPHRFDIHHIPADDLSDPESLPTPVLTSREGLELSVSRRRSSMTYTLRNSDADELHFVQSGRALFKTEFGTIEAGPLDFVCIPRAIGYRIESPSPEYTSLILSSPQPLKIDTPAPLGMVYQGRSVRRPVLQQEHADATGHHILRIRSYDSVSEFVSDKDPLNGDQLAEGPCPVWVLNLAEVNPLSYGGPGGPPGQFLTSPDTGVMSYSMSARAGGRPPVHVNADYDELIIYAKGPGAWGSITEPGMFTWVPKSVTHHGPDENVPEGYQAWLIEVRPTMRMTAAAEAVAVPIETSNYSPL